MESKKMSEDDFWRLVRVNKPYGKYYSAHITCNGMDYNAESRLDQGENEAKDKLFHKLKALGHLKKSH